MSYARATRAIVQPRSTTGVENPTPGIDGTTTENASSARPPWLSDSPVGQLAYSELFESFGNGTSLVTSDQVLEQVSLYWLTNSAAGSVRYHYEEAHAQREPVVSTGRLGVAVFRHDFQTIRSLAERDNANIQHWSELDGGGHFAVMENPTAVVADLRTFFADDPQSTRAVR